MITPQQVVKHSLHNDVLSVPWQHINRCLITACITTWLFQLRHKQPSDKHYPVQPTSEGWFELANISDHTKVSEYILHKSGNKGLISVDRRAEPTLILTIPCSLFKSSTNDLSLKIFEINISIWYWASRKRHRLLWCVYTSEEVIIVTFPAWILT